MSIVPKSNIEGINPEHPKAVLDGVIEVGMKIKSWSMNYEDEKLVIEFYPSPHCKTRNKSCNIKDHECSECDACKYTECECN